MKYAVIVVDMLKDSVEGDKHGAIAVEAEKIIPAIQRLLSHARSRGLPVIYACDSFLPGDLMFQGRLRPHALRGTVGAQVIEALQPQPGEMVLEKRSLSAFFRTDLDLTLRVLGVEGIAVAGITTSMCVLLTALDAVSSGFRAIILEDCSAAHKPEVHQQVLDLYRRSSLHPVLRVATLEEFTAETAGR